MSKNVAVVGYRDGRHVIEQIHRNTSSDYCVKCLADNDNSHWGEKINDVTVCSVDDAIEFYLDNKIDAFIIAVRKGYSRFCIIEQLKDAGVNDIVLIKPYVLTYRQDVVFDKGDYRYNLQWLVLDNNEKPIIHHLEANIADGCNLSCKGCLHFSNLYERDEFPDAEELLNSIAEIQKHCEIFQFRVLGGEPLLNPNLEGFLIRLRQILPNADLAVISNGILIPKVAESLLRVMRENYIGFNLSLYPPTLKMKDRIYKRLEDIGVAYGSHEVVTDKFERFIMLKPSVGDNQAYKVCEPRGILVVKGNSIYRCPVEAYIDRYYEKYDIPMKAPDGINVFDKSVYWRKLINDLYTKPRELCRYCSPKSDLFEWGNGEPKKDDWLVL